MIRQETVTDVVSRYKARSLSIYRKLRFGAQEQELAPEIRDCALAFEKAAKAGEWGRAIELSDRILYMVETAVKRGLSAEVVLQNLKNDAKELAGMIQATGD